MILFWSLAYPTVKKIQQEFKHYKNIRRVLLDWTRKGPKVLQFFTVSSFGMLSPKFYHTLIGQSRKAIPSPLF